MKQIPLTRNKIAMVDDKDYEWLMKYNWITLKQRKDFYAIRNSRSLITGRRIHIRMHREILMAPIDMLVDHRNHNGLDNQRKNIRLCTHSQNQHNRLPQHGTSQYKGVHWDKNNKKWIVQIAYNGIRSRLGSFADEREAAKCYDARAEELFGEFAYVNFTNND